MRSIWRKVSALALALATLAGCGAGGKRAASADEFAVAITEEGFVPAETVVPKGRPVTLVFTRKTDQTCATELVFADNRRYQLPLGRPVRVAIPAGPEDTLHYACGMSMFRGTVVVH